MPGEDQQIYLAPGRVLLAAHPSKTVSIWLAIVTSIGKTAACSSRPALIGMDPSSTDSAVTMRKTCCGFTVDDIESHGGVVDVELSAGHFSMHSDLLLHGSGPNPSDRRRCGMIFRYAAADVRSLWTGKRRGAHQRARPHGTMGQPAAARWLKRFTGGNTTIPPLSEDP